MEFNDGNKYHYVTDANSYARHRDMYEMRTCSAINGQMYVDPQFEYQRRILQPLMRGYLHYQFPYQNAGSPEKQADFFCNVIGTLRSNEMVMLDTEGASGLSDPCDFAVRWCARVEARFSTLCWIYVPQALARVLTREVLGPRLIKAPRYSGNANRGTPPSWSYDVWQYTDRGFFPGSPHGPGDVNYSDLTTQQLLDRCTQFDRPTLRKGDSGPWVRELQSKLARVW